MFIEFPRGIGQGELPPLFVIGPDGEGQLVNCRVRQNYMIVDRLFAAAELRLGSASRRCGSYAPTASCAACSAAIRMVPSSSIRPGAAMAEARDERGRDIPAWRSPH